MPIVVILGCIATLLALTIPAAAFAGRPAGPTGLYTACLAATAVALGAALTQLIAAAPAVSAVLPIGLPWLGAHLRLDALALLVVLCLQARSALSEEVIEFGAEEPDA